jgi:hypothetical protein
VTHFAVPTCILEVHVVSQNRERSYIGVVKGIDIASVSTISFLRFLNCSDVVGVIFLIQI